jgi:biotin carboxyl carrier protein
MKMENEVKAGVDGRVTAVAVEAGRTVTIGDVLAEIG